jgi:bacillithiol biosynthesis deacetylase BshB1
MANNINNSIDFLAIGAHPDDIELSCGGTIAKLTGEGKTVVIADLTGGELGTRGSGEIRAQESAEAARILGVKTRVNLGIPDGSVEVNDENVHKIIQVIRRYRPKAVIVNQEYERHPDHEAAHRLLRTAMFKSGLGKYESEYEGKTQEPYRTRKVYSYMQSYEFRNKNVFFVDISDTFETKMKAISAYVSQVYVPGQSDMNGPTTRLSRPEFIDELKSRAMYWGSLVGVRYAEAFCSIEPVVIRNISDLLL